MAVGWAGLALTAGPRYSAGQKECHRTSQTSPLCDCDGAKQKQGQLFLRNFMESCLVEHSQNQEHRPHHKRVRHLPPFAAWVIGVSSAIITLPYFTLLPLDEKLLRYLRIAPTFWQHLIQSQTMLSWTFSKILKHQPSMPQHPPSTLSRTCSMVHHGVLVFSFIATSR